ncbi:hypothetical protein [Thalassobacillus pellis]|uniref:hypothetical protein n=1 Tax=Thalassobacillus pellis TaxID=748008 RepID=UPI001EF7DD0A|nr:hypothetical protein [Thalassobacillus pellis]MBM7553504.1 hypothetical protein [Thalassobacillus pellis]
MEVMETRDYQLIAELNKYVHDLHYNLYPDLFKPYDFEKMKTFFQPLVHNENYIFLLQKEGQHAIGYAWIEIRDYPESPFKKPYQSVYIHQLSIKESE